MNENENQLKVFAEHLLAGDSWEKLYTELRELRDAGFSSDEVLLFLENLRAKCTAEQQEDTLLDLMDYGSGYCRNDLAIWPREP